MTSHHSGVLIVLEIARDIQRLFGMRQKGRYTTPACFDEVPPGYTSVPVVRGSANIFQIDNDFE